MRKAKIYPRFYPGQLVTTIGPKPRNYRIRSLTIYCSCIQYNLWDGDDNFETVYEDEIEYTNENSKIGYYITM